MAGNKTVVAQTWQQVQDSARMGESLTHRGTTGTLGKKSKLALVANQQLKSSLKAMGTDTLKEGGFSMFSQH